MIIAQEKKRNNIAEYILYMWQIEDLIRACKFDMDIINKQVVSQYDQPPHVKKQIYDWYDSLVDMMRRENVQQKGHLQLVMGVVHDLDRLHLQLLAHPEHTDYQQLFVGVAPHVAEFHARLQSSVTCETEVGLTALYSWLLMRLQKREITPETTRAMELFSRWMAQLTYLYHQHENGELDME